MKSQYPLAMVLHGLLLLGTWPFLQSVAPGPEKAWVWKLGRDRAFPLGYPIISPPGTPCSISHLHKTLQGRPCPIPGAASFNLPQITVLNAHSAFDVSVLPPSHDSRYSTISPCY